MDISDESSQSRAMEYEPARLLQFMLANTVPPAVRKQFLQEIWQEGDITIPGSPWWAGKRFAIKDQNCTIRFVGEVGGTGKEWVGVEWDNPSNGKHNGSYNGEKYFECLSSSATAASFVRSLKEKDIDIGVDFDHAVMTKYAAAPGQPVKPPQYEQIVISGKVAEEVGFDKISELQSRLHELKYVIVDGERIRRATRLNDLSFSSSPFSEILELDLSRNLFESFKEVCEICQGLRNLRKLTIDGNRFQDLTFRSFPTRFDNQTTEGFGKTFQEVKELSMDDILLPWDAIVWVRNLCPSLEKLSISTNHLNSLSCLLPGLHLRSLVMEYNDFTSFWPLVPLQQLQTLENLSLKGNKISSISEKNHPITPFPSNISYIDLSYNEIDSWSFIDELSYIFTGLIKLRLSGNRLYTSIADMSKSDSDELFMVTIARVKSLENLNFSPVSKAERNNAEMFYLSLIAREISSALPESEQIIISKHKRYKELCELHGEPTVVRKGKGEINPNFLEARLIKFEFVAREKVTPEQIGEVVMRREIPKSLDVYRVKGLVGKMFGIKPLSLKLIWETGEWDPVAGYEELEESGGDEEENEVQKILVNKEAKAIKEKGKWMKREVELVDGTRQVGFCVDGLEARVRVELR